MEIISYLTLFLKYVIMVLSETEQVTTVCDSRVECLQLYASMSIHTPCYLLWCVNLYILSDIEARLLWCVKAVCCCYSQHTPSLPLLHAVINPAVAHFTDTAINCWAMMWNNKKTVWHLTANNIKYEQYEFLPMCENSTILHLAISWQ